MARVKRAVNAKKSRRQVLERAKGYYGNKSRSVRAANEQVAPLCERGHETGLIDAAVFLRRQQHAGVAGMHGEGEHPATEGGDFCRTGGPPVSIFRR